MNDLDIAKKALKENNLSIVFVKDGKVIFKGNSKGVMDLILAIDRFGSRLENSSVADSIVGKAAASLSIFLKVNSVFVRKISKLAVDILKEKNIHFEYDELVEKMNLFFADNNDAIGIIGWKILNQIAETDQGYKRFIQRFPDEIEVHIEIGEYVKESIERKIGLR